MRDAWNLDSADRAARVLKRLAGSLEHDHPGAAASIREGLDETLTVQRLGLTGDAAAYAADDEHHREPERQRRALLAQRQALAWWPDDSTLGGERAAEKHFRRVRGYRDLQHLVGALDALAPPDGVVADVA